MNGVDAVKLVKDIQYLAKTVGGRELPKHAVRYIDVLRMGEREGVPTFVLAGVGHLKSSALNLMILQDLLNDDDPHYLLGSKAGDVIGATVGWLETALEKIYPDIIRARRKETAFRWASTQFMVPGWRSASKFPSFYGATLGQNIEGMRFGKGLLDDPIDREAQTSEAYREDALHWYESTFLERLNRSAWFGGIGSPWHKEDLFVSMMERGVEFHIYPVRRKPVPDVYRNFGNVHWHGGDYDILWPETWTLEGLAQKERDVGTIKFGQRFLCDPYTIEGARFKPHWFKYYDIIPEEVVRRLVVFQGVDLATGKGKNADDTAIITIGHDPQTNTIYVLDSFGNVIDPLETERMIKVYGEKWKPRKIFVEDAQAQAMFVARLKADTMLPIFPINPESKDKLSRIDTLAPSIENGRILFHRTQQDLINEFLNLPGGRHDDLPDALEMACRELLRRSGGSPVSKNLGRRGDDWRNGAFGDRPWPDGHEL